MNDKSESSEAARWRAEAVRLERTLARLIEERECGHLVLCLENPLRPDLPTSRNPCRQCRLIENLRPDQVSLEDLPLNSRAYHALLALGCRQVSDVKRIPANQLTRFPNIGPSTAKHILEVIGATQPALPCFDREPERFATPLAPASTKSVGRKPKKKDPNGWLDLLKDIFGPGYRWRMACPINEEAFSVALGYALSRLTDRMRGVVIKRYGIEDGQRRTLAEVAEAQSVTSERVRQLQINALARLRKPSACVILRGFLPPPIGRRPQPEPAGKC